MHIPQSRTRKIALTSLFTSLYALLVFASAPLSFQLIQVRIADAMIPLAMIFGWPAIVGVTLGCAISNFVSPLPSVIMDVTFGSMANLLAGIVVWKVGKWGDWRRELLSCTLATVILTFVVGTYLSLLLGFPVEVGWVSIAIGSAISVNVIGFILIRALRRISLERIREIL
jgi:uncharacterized membrane protein